MCPDLHRALFDLIAARGVEARGLLEEELSGCLECLRERNRDDQFTHIEVFSVLNNNTLILRFFYNRACVYSTVTCGAPSSHTMKLFQYRLDKNKSVPSYWPVPFAKLSGLISSCQATRLAHTQYAQQCVSACMPLDSPKLLQNLFFIFILF